MDLFHKESLKLLIYLGFWKPENITGFRSMMYDAYSVLIVGSILAFASSQLADLLHINSQTENPVDHVFLTLTSSCICLKIFSVFYSRNSIRRILRNVGEDELRIRDFKEHDICEDFSRSVRPISLWSLGYIILATLFYEIDIVQKNAPEFKLPVNSWLPYSYSDPVIYWLSSMELVVSSYIASIFNTTYNVLFFEIMMQISAQVKLLKHRNRVMIEALIESDGDEHALVFLERRLVDDSVTRHVAILSLARDVESVFGAVILVQYLVSSLTMCTSAFILSRTVVFSANFVSLSLYLIAMVHQMAILCAAGHHVYHEFDTIGDAVYDTDWRLLRAPTRQSMQLIMTCARQPFILNCAGFLDLNMAAFSNVIKLAYSIYNVL